jgi:hypothetical protein
MNPMQTKLRRVMLATAALMICAPAAFAVIIALLPLQTVIRSSQYIVVAKVEKFYPDKPAMLLSVEEDLKGKLPMRKLPVFLKGDSEAEKLKHVPQLLKRIAPDLPIILFIEDKMDKNDPKMMALAYTNGTWMQFVGDRTAADSAVWSLTHGEPYLRRTFKGPTDELKKTLVDVLAGKKAAPALDKKEAPGFGPEVK